jgi:hypothetical protein
MILKAGRQARQQVQTPIGFPQQRRSCVRGHGAAVKPSHDIARKMRLELEAGLVTLCHRDGRFLLGANCCLETQLRQKKQLFARPCVGNNG